MENELLRRYLRQAALKIASELPDSIQSPDILRRINALDSLLDRLDLMREENPDDSQTETLQIEFVDATGRISSTPPWATDNDDDDEPYPQPHHIAARIQDEV